MAAMLRDSVAAAVVHTRPRAIPLAMITMRKSTHGFPFASHMGSGLRCKLGFRCLELTLFSRCFDLKDLTPKKRFEPLRKD